MARVPGQIPALLRLVEVCVDGGLEQPMYVAQEQLTDAYLAANQAAEARVIAEDLVAREPWEPAHIDCFRRALVMLRVSDPDTLIAERLSGQAPFMAHDHFSTVRIRHPPRPRRPSRLLMPAEPSEEVEAAPEESPVSRSSLKLAAPAARLTRRTSSNGEEIDLTGELGDLDAGRRRQGTRSRQKSSIRPSPRSGPMRRPTAIFRPST